MPDGSTGSDLRDCESVVEEGAELQWRQVHPTFLKNGVVSQEAFVGTPQDRDQASTVRSSKRTADEAYAHHTGALQLSSAGTWAASVDEITQVGCRVIDDADCDDVDVPGHSYIDFAGLTKAAKKAARFELARLAQLRGKQSADDEDSTSR